ncbi:MAG TPA: diaminopimelate decarboxylase [Verrucomicrobiae bacterium]|nr:diaminopimelate decarboxylase [Verrucomicrobiae bacterium]
MHDFRYEGNQLYCEGVAVSALAQKFGTPLYVYSQRTLTRHFQSLDRALAPLDHRICFAMKANSNLSVLRTLANLGSAFDVVSAGELGRVIAAGADPQTCVFAGVAKTEAEIEFALRQNVYSFNVESEAELQRVNKIAARLKMTAPTAVRVNPNISAHTHAKITTGTYQDKFGVAFEQIPALYSRARRLKNVRLRGLQMHIGSQMTDVGPIERAVKKIVPLGRKLAETYGLEFLSIGGGIGIVYQPALDSGLEAWWKSPAANKILTPEKYAAHLVPLVQTLKLKILIEPGRFICGNAGILVTRVEYLKRTGSKNFVIVDAAMNDLIRPAFYDAYHEIVPLRRKTGPTIKADLVGGICESGDYFAKNRVLPKVAEGDFLALLSAGAYSFAMASNYNTRPLAAEVLVNGKDAAVVRRRQPVAETWAGENIAPWLARGGF